MKGSMSTELGIITISPEVIAKYAGSVAVECFGIVGMAAVNMKDGLVRLLKKDSQRSFASVCSAANVLLMKTRPRSIGSERVSLRDPRHPCGAHGR